MCVMFVSILPKFLKKIWWLLNITEDVPTTFKHCQRFLKMFRWISKVVECSSRNKPRHPNLPYVKRKSCLRTLNARVVLTATSVSFVIVSDIINSWFLVMLRSSRRALYPASVCRDKSYHKSLWRSYCTPQVCIALFTALNFIASRMMSLKETEMLSVWALGSSLSKFCRRIWS